MLTMMNRQGIQGQRDRRRRRKERPHPECTRLERTPRHLRRQRRHSLDPRKHDRWRARPLPQSGDNRLGRCILLRTRCRRDLEAASQGGHRHERQQARELLIRLLHRNCFNVRTHRQLPSTSISIQRSKGRRTTLDQVSGSRMGQDCKMQLRLSWLHRDRTHNICARRDKGDMEKQDSHGPRGRDP